MTAALLLLALGAVATGQEPHPVDDAGVAAALAEEDAGEAGAEIAEAMRAGDYARAEALLLEANRARPESAAVLRLLGGVYFVRGDRLQAAVALKKAQSLAPLDEASRFTLAMSYVAIGRRDWARPELAALAAARPENALYPYWEARLDYDETRYEAAIGRLDRALELDPGFARAWDNLGLCHEALGRTDAALEAYQRAVELNRGEERPSPWPPLNLGLLLGRLGRQQDAEARFREAVAADPGFPQAHYQLGLVLEKTGRPDEAVAALEEAVRLEPAYPEPHYALARLYRTGGRSDAAGRALERFRELKQRAQTPPGVSPRN